MSQNETFVGAAKFFLPAEYFPAAVSALRQEAEADPNGIFSVSSAQRTISWLSLRIPSQRRRSGDVLTPVDGDSDSTRMAISTIFGLPMTVASMEIQTLIRSFIQ